jgi:serine/threonine protein kinase
MIGTKLAHYEITSHLGTGGMGEVYQATDSKLGRSVAIKLLPSAFASDPDRLSRFRREAQLLASLNHPNNVAKDGRFLINTVLTKRLRRSRSSRIGSHRRSSTTQKLLQGRDY